MQIPNLSWQQVAAMAIVLAGAVGLFALTPADSRFEALIALLTTLGGGAWATQALPRGK